MPPRWQVLVLFIASAVMMAVLRDVRVPLDGSAYALGVQRLAGGSLEDVFRWSHPLHVPVLFLAYRLAGLVWQMDVLAFYQGFDILLGAGGLCLLFILVRDVTGKSAAALAACLLVLFSWVYWVESVTADEKILGFFFVLTYLVLLRKFLADSGDDNRGLTPVRAGILAVVLALAILLHASAVLVVPYSLYLVLRKRAFRFGAAVSLSAAGLVLGAYAWILAALGTTEPDQVVSYFSTGLSRYSVAATGFSGTLWARSVVQGTTKVLWAVFSEDGLAAGMVFAALNLLFAALMAGVVWRFRRNRDLQGFLVLFLTVAVFGMTYAPEAPDSYFLALVPLALFFAKAMDTGRWKYPALGFLVLLAVNNGSHFLDNSPFRDEGVDRRYQEAIAGRLSAGDALVVLDATTGLDSGTQTIMPVHAYFNGDLDHIPSSRFFENPRDERFLLLAGQERLFIEGICFEEFATREKGEVEDTAAFRELAETYRLEPVVRFTEYSSLYHRSYKNVYRISLTTGP